MLSVDVVTGRGSFRVTAAFTATRGITVIRAPSGAGKTLVLHTIAGLVRPHSGRIEIASVVVAQAATQRDALIHIKSQDRKVAMVFQDGVLLPHRNPIANVELGIRPGSIRPKYKTERTAQALRLLDSMEASHLANASTKHLSGGEQQRVSLARAIAGNPDVLLLDEPFSALDHDSRVRLRHTLRRIVDERRLTAVLVTHDSEDVDALADRVVDLEPGRYLEKVGRT